MYGDTNNFSLAWTFNTVWGETVLKVKVPPVRIENSLSPLGVQTFQLSPRLFRQSGGGKEGGFYVSYGSISVSFRFLRFCAAYLPEE